MISSEIFSMVTSCLTELTTFRKLATPNKLYNVMAMYIWQRYLSKDSIEIIFSMKIQVGTLWNYLLTSENKSWFMTLPESCLLCAALFWVKLFSAGVRLRSDWLIEWALFLLTTFTGCQSYKYLVQWSSLTKCSMLFRDPCLAYNIDQLLLLVINYSSSGIINRCCTKFISILPLHGERFCACKISLLSCFQCCNQWDDEILPSERDLSSDIYHTRDVTHHIHFQTFPCSGEISIPAFSYNS